jgi:hypothetical protein
MTVVMALSSRDDMVTKRRDQAEARSQVGTRGDRCEDLAPWDVMIAIADEIENHHPEVRPNSNQAAVIGV